MTPTVTPSVPVRRLVFVLGVLVILGLLAGCSSTSPGQTGPVGLHLANDDNTTHSFEVTVVEGEIGPRGIGVTRDGRDVEYSSGGQGLSTTIFNQELGTVRSIELPANRTRSVETVPLAPGERVQLNVTSFTTGDTLVVVDHQGDRIVALVTANCDESGLSFVSVTAGPTRPYAGYFCG
jgi:hypothetical protein